jgi:hypothetical protein
MSRFQLLAAALCLGCLATPAPAHWTVGLSIGIPLYYPRPYYPAWGYYYRPYPLVYAAPAPVVVVPATAQAPVVVQPAPSVIPVPPTSAAIVPAAGTPPAAGVVVQANSTGNASRAGQLLQQLNQPQESARQDAALELGRLKSVEAVDPLIAALTSDSSPSVRDAAARALGLIGSPRGLTALIQAAQLDQDRDVRRSAQFAVEVIRTNLRN